MTEVGIAIHPNRPGLALACRSAGLPIKPSDEIIAAVVATRETHPRGEDRTIALVEDRNGQVLDIIRIL